MGDCATSWHGLGPDLQSTSLHGKLSATHRFETAKGSPRQRLRHMRCQPGRKALSKSECRALTGMLPTPGTESLKLTQPAPANRRYCCPFILAKQGNSVEVASSWTKPTTGHDFCLFSRRACSILIPVLSGRLILDTEIPYAHLRTRGGERCMTDAVMLWLLHLSTYSSLDSPTRREHNMIPQPQSRVSYMP